MDELNRGDAISRRITLALSLFWATSLGHASGGDSTSGEKSIRHLLQSGIYPSSRDLSSKTGARATKRKVADDFDPRWSESVDRDKDKRKAVDSKQSRDIVPNQFKTDFEQLLGSESATNEVGRNDNATGRSLSDFLKTGRASDSLSSPLHLKSRVINTDEMLAPEHFLAPSRQPTTKSPSSAAAIGNSKPEEAAESSEEKYDLAPLSQEKREGSNLRSRADGSRLTPSASVGVPSGAAVPSAKFGSDQESNQAESLAQKIGGAVDDEFSRREDPRFEKPSPVVLLKPPSILIDSFDDTGDAPATHDATATMSLPSDRQSGSVESETLQKSIVAQSPGIVLKSKVNLFADPDKEANPNKLSDPAFKAVNMPPARVEAPAEQNREAILKSIHFPIAMGPSTSGSIKPVESAKAAATEAKGPDVTGAPQSFKPTLPSVTMHKKRLLELAQLSLTKSQESLKRGATHTARKHALAALQSVVAMLDAEYGGNRHSQQLSSAFDAIRESKDFCGQFGVIDSRVLKRMVTVHETLALKQRDLNVLTALEATEAYLETARKQLVSAVGGVREGGRALVMLGQIEFQLAKASDTHATSVAVMIQQAAVETNRQDAVAYRVLGNSFFHIGLLEEASNCLTTSLKLQPNRLAYECLLEIARQLGDIDTARTCLIAMKDPRMGSDNLVRNLSPEDFAATYRPVSRTIQSKQPNTDQESLPAKAAPNARISFGSLIPFRRR